jgi:plasmid stabilization system protein ParE
MVCEVIWSPLALQTFLGNIAYLQEEWTEKEIIRFTNAVDRKLKLLSQFPKVGSPTSSKQTCVKQLLFSESF